MGAAHDSTELSCVLGSNGIQVGGQLDFKSSMMPADYQLAIGYTQPQYFGSLSASETLQTFKLVTMFKATDELSLLCSAHSKIDSYSTDDADNQLDIGAAYTVSKELSVQGKYKYQKAKDKEDKPIDVSSFFAAMNLKFLPKVCLQAAVELPLKDKTPKTPVFGLTLG